MDIQFRAMEEEIARRVLLDDVGVADELRSDTKATNREFKALFKNARVKLKPLVMDRAPLTEVLERLTVDEQLWRLAADVYRHGAGTTPADIRGFVDRCPPVKAVLLSMCVGLCQGAKSHPLDLLMAAYLPYCDTFVTRDDCQYADLRLVAERIGLSTGIQSYSTWRKLMLV